MGRNKVILLIIALLAFYLALPSKGVYLIIKSYMLAIAPYIMIGLIIYLIITIQLIKKALYRLSENICEKNVLPVTKLLRFSFDVKRMIGTVNLVNVYKRVNANKSISYKTKNAMYETLRKKRIEIPLPMGVPLKGKN